MADKEGSQMQRNLAFALVGLAFFLTLCAFCASTVPLLYANVRDLGAASQLPGGNAATAELEQRVLLLEKDQNSRMQQIAWALDQKLYYITGAALFISSLAAFFGWKSYKDLDGVIREKIRVTLENELYQLDPANLTVRLPETHTHKGKIESRLRAAGLKNIKTYTELSDRCKVGLTIVPVENEEQEKDFIAFLEREQPEVDHAAFVLYVSTGHRLSQETINKHDRAATANMPSTVVTAILAISRGLHRDHVISKKEGA